MTKRIFVFGSNLAGIHGAGSALEAKKNHGAVQGCGFGLSGNSFAIPTKDENLKPLDLYIIAGYIEAFLEFAEASYYLNWQFDVVDVGCGLAGYTPRQIAPFFTGSGAYNNINFLGELKRLVSTDAPPF